MSKRKSRSQRPQKQEKPSHPTPYPSTTPPPSEKRDGNWLGPLTLAGVVAVLMFSVSNWWEIGQIQTSLDDRLAQIENMVSDGAAPAQRGPDPNRVYPIKTTGAPMKGPAEAPVTIAAFSDFQ